MPCTPHTHAAPRRAIAATLLLVALCGLASAQGPGPGPGPGPGRLPALGLRADAVTVSGLSSGAYMAGQFSVAYSASVSGAAILAGGPYGCSRGSVFTAALKCACPAEPSFQLTLAGAFGFGCDVLSEAVYANLAQSALAVNGDDIDAPTHIARQRIWLFSGGHDRVVDPVLVAAAGSFYRSQGVAPARLHLEHRSAAGHGFVSAGASQPCAVTAPPYLIACDGLDAAEALLRWMYPDLPADPGAALAGRLRTYSQTRYLPGGDTGLDTSGWLYVPAACEPAGAHCRLHVVFHGCEQGQSFQTRPGQRFGRQFVDGAGYNRWAEAGGIVVLYPQVRASNGGTPGSTHGYNPKGCWDYWGYSTDTIDTAPLRFGQRSAPQMKAVKAMIDDLVRAPP